MSRVRVSWPKAATLLDQMLVSGGNFAYFIVLARMLDIDEFGRASILWLAVLFVNSLQVAAVVMPMLTLSGRFSGRERQEYYQVVLVHQHAFNGVIALGCVAAWLVARPFVAVSPTDLLLVVGLSTAFHLEEYYRRCFFCESSPPRALVIDCVAYLGRFAPLVYLHLEHDDLTVTQAMLALTAAHVAAVALGMVLRGRPARVDRATLRRLSSVQWRAAKYLIPSALLQWLSVNLHLAMAGFILGAREVGVIRLGQTLVNAGNVYLQTVETTLPLRITRTQQDTGWQVALRETLVSMLRGGIVIGVGGLLAWAFAPELMTVVFGKGYDEYASVIPWFAAIYLIAFLFVFVRALLRAADGSRVIFRAYVLSSVVTVIEIYPLQAHLGIHGVLLGMLISYVVLVGYATWSLLRGVPHHADR